MASLLDSSIGAGTAGPIVSTGAKLIVLVLSGGDATNNPPTDSEGNTYNPRTLFTGGGFSSQMQIWDCFNPITSAAHSASSTDVTPAIAILAYDAGNAFDQENGDVPVEGNPTTAGPITPTEDNEIIVAAGGTVWLAGPPSIDSGFNLEETIDVNGGVNFSLAVADLIQGAAVTVNPEWTPVGAAGSTICIIASYKTGSAPAVGNPSRLSSLGVG